MRPRAGDTVLVTGALGSVGRAHPDPERLASMLRAVAEGTIVIPIAKRFPVSEIREAHELAEKGAGGKVLLRL